MWKFVFVLSALILIVNDVIGQGADCPSYSVTHLYGPNGVTTQQGQGLSGALRGEPGPPGKAGPPGIGQKGERGSPGPRTITRNYWTRTIDGCSCYFNRTRDDCPCCYSGGCQCSVRHPDQCVECGHGQDCGIDELPKSCEFIDGTRSGTYLIDPDPDRCQPFYVYCDFTNEGATTMVRHDSSMEIEAESCEPARCYTRNIRYTASMEQIKTLIDVSETCRQFIKYRCIGSVLFQGTDFFSTWVSRDGVKQRYWGGATSERDYYCACGETGTCVDSTKFCNCDLNSSPETSDEGYLTDKDKLPVTAVQFGDLFDAGEEGWHTIGRLECSGRA